MAEPARTGEVAVRDCAILFADLAGYSTMMGHDERGTLEFIGECSHMIRDAGARHGGELVQVTGDGFLLLFVRTLDAVEFGVELHRLVAKRQAGAAAPAEFRVGIHRGAVHTLGGTIHGHAVNIAARLQTEALPGTCVLSGAVHDEVRGRCAHAFEAVGSPPLKNIAERIPLYRTLPADRGAVTMQPAPACIAVLGGLTVHAGRAEIHIPAGNKASALLGYLALAEGMRERADKLMRLLWPDAPLPAARRAFRACRGRLVRQLAALPEAPVQAAGGHLGLNELCFDTDLHLMLRTLRRDRVPPELLRIPDWPERILAGLDAVSPLYAGWLEVTRSVWRNRIMGELSGLAARAAPGDAACGEAARAVLLVEPGNEAASARLIRHHAASGNRPAAMQEYARLERYLAGAHGLSPGDGVRRALDEATTAAVPGASAFTTPAAVPAGGRLIRIRVEPFRGAAGDDLHLIDGFRSELVANLARFREWSVSEGPPPARNGVSVVPQAGHYAIAAEWRRGAPPVLHLRLSDLALGRIVWSDDIRLELDRWSGLQREVIGRIAAHLDTYISADRLANAIGGGVHDATTHDTWLQAERIFARWSPEAADEAETILHRLIERDPSFAPAWSSLASFRNVRHVIRPGLARDAESERAAHRLAERAVELDPLDARNQLAVAWTAALTGAFDRASIHFDLAASLNPNSAATLVSCAMGHAFTGQADRGETLVAHVRRISPMLSDYQWCYVASVHFLAGHYEQALEASQRSGDRIVDDQGWAAATLVRLGRVDEAHRAFERLVDAVRPVWAGDSPPTAEAVAGWFCGAYPLRRESDRRLLEKSLQAAMRGQ